MNILIVPSWYPTPEKPVNGVFIREQADALSAVHNMRVLYVEVLTRGNKQRPRHLVREDRGYAEELVQVRNMPLVWQFAYLLAMARALFRLKRTFKPDVVHSHIAVPASWAAVMLRGILGVPVVLTENSSEFDSWLKRPGLRWMARWAFSRADVIIAVSEGQRQRIERVFKRKRKLFVIPNIVNTGRFTPTGLPPIEDGYRLLFIGLLDTTQKGLHVLLEALAEIKKEGMLALPLHVDIVGDGALRRDYQKQSVERGVDEMVTFRGLLPHEAIDRVLSECHALVLPSLHEALPLVVIEAMASGRPVIATRCGGPEYMVDKRTGIVVEPGQPKALADAIARVLTYLELYDPVQIAALAESRYSYRSVTYALTQIYDALTKKR
jgi:glycosyltransferase involved in cell wall biosynthesis